MDKIEIVEKINKEYLDIVNSKEYRTGNRINKIKKNKLKNIFSSIKSLRIQKKVNKISSKCEKRPFFYNKGKIISDNCVVYSCVTNGYDKISKPLINSCDYILFSDDDSKKNINDWQIKKIAKKTQSFKGNIINRYYKMHPFEFLSEYDFSIYIDGNVQTISDMKTLCELAKKSKSGIAMHEHSSRNCVYLEADACIVSKRGNKVKIKEQVDRYKKEKFPQNFGLFEATIIVVDLHNPMAKKILSEWYDEFLKSESGRDQLSFPYVLWKNGLTKKDIGILGNNLLSNPMFRINILGNHNYK